LMSKLNDQDTKKIAGLIKIHIPDAEMPKYTEQLNTVLDAIPVLQELDTEKVALTSQTHGLQNILREDEAEPGLDMTKYPNTKNFKHGNFVVDKVL
jgi:aspartyl-tRNA(Asn)/glutamyl-tRNA(Gln) amidotransferase subunit C